MSAKSRMDRRWSNKFRDALRGMKRGVRGQSSFFVHFFCTAAVVAAGLIMKVQQIQWCLLVLCITLVLTAELLNTALESMAKAVERRHNVNIGDALDIGSAAVLTASIGAAIIGLVIFGERLSVMLDW